MSCFSRYPRVLCERHRAGTDFLSMELRLVPAQYDLLGGFRRGRGEDIGLAVEGGDETVNALLLQDGSKL